MIPELEINNTYGYRHFPNIDDEFLREYYATQYQAPLEVDEKWLAHTLWHDINSFSVGGTLLDVGSGNGEFARWMGQHGWAVETVEQNGRGVYKTFDEIGKEYDLITALNVLEHVADPKEFLLEIARLSHPQTQLVVRVPNDFNTLQAIMQKWLGEYWVHYPDHITYFGVNSLGRLLQDCGWRVELVHCDFPMEYFLLMGLDYINNRESGKMAHNLRRNMEMCLPPWKRRDLWGMWADNGIGRNIIMYARRADD